MQPATDNAYSPPLCSYSDGMFSNEPRQTFGAWDSVFELRATCFHEAAHAVVGYTFGERLFSAGVFVDREIRKGRRYETYGGEVRHGPSGVRRTVAYPYRPMHFRIGVAVAAGPACERRYRYREGLPMRLLGASEGDHQLIDGIAKALEDRGRDRWAYRRLVWYAAQRLLARDDVWGAVGEVADELFYAFADLEDEAAAGIQWAYIEPRDVYRACRRAGLKHGMFRVSMAGRRAAA
jgi:hypothetical protein